LYGNNGAYANIYYSYSNTAYYVQPNSTSNLYNVVVNSGLVVNSQIFFSTNNGNTVSSGYNNAGDGSDIWFNYRGYADGFSYYRNFNVGNGRGSAILWCYGNNGYCGINNGQAASYTLHVSGNIYASGNITAYSDARKKENIVTIDNPVDKVKQLRGVYYNRIDEIDDKYKLVKREVGVVAQEIMEVLPEVVYYAEDIDEYSVTYGPIVSILIEAIKEQQKQIEELRDIINGKSK